MSKFLFLSTLSLRRATRAASITPTASRNFYPRSPCGERHGGRVRNAENLTISIHALLAESDFRLFLIILDLFRFLSTLSLRRATSRSRRLKSLRCVFLSTLSLRRATDDILAGVNELLISIHALLAESDSILDYFSAIMRQFLSTLSLRRATHAPNHNLYSRNNFYPRSPCGERHPARPTASTGATKISIHALLAESDEPTTSRNNKNNVFLSTLSLRRATRAL